MQAKTDETNIIQKTITVNLSNKDHKYIEGHTVNGGTIYYFLVYLYYFKQFSENNL